MFFDRKYWDIVTTTVIICIFIAPNIKIIEFGNNLDPEGMAHDELPHLDLHYLHPSL